MSEEQKIDKRINNLKNLKGSSGGRPKGAKNKNRISSSLQSDLKQVYDRLDGVEGLLRWIKRDKTGKNRERFYHWIVGLLPRETNINVTGHIQHSLEKLSTEELQAIIDAEVIEQPQLPDHSNHSVEHTRELMRKRND